MQTVADVVVDGLKRAGTPRLFGVPGVAANVRLLEAVRALPARLAARSLITSGYLASERPVLTGYTIAERRDRDGWAADLHSAI